MSDSYNSQVRQVVLAEVRKVTGVLHVLDGSLRYDVLMVCCACTDGYELIAIQSVEVVEDRVINMAVNPTDQDRVQLEFVMESRVDHCYGGWHQDFNVND